MALYDYRFCQGILYGGWDSGVINNLKDARKALEKNFADMDLENASVREEIQEIVDEMILSIDRLIDDIQAVQFR